MQPDVSRGPTAPLKIVFGGRIARAPIIEALKAIADLELTVVPLDADVSDSIGDAEILVMSNPRGEDGAAIASYLRSDQSKVRWVQIVSAGVDGLIRYPLPAALILTNQGGAVATTVAEHVFAMLLSSVRRLDAIYDSMRSQTWASALSSQTSSLEGKSICVVGMGHIGHRVARLARAFGMDVTCLTRTVALDAGFAVRGLDELPATLPASDVVVVCLALTTHTRHLFDANMFARFKQGAMFVNVARGEIVDSQALHDSLQSGHLGAACIDVAENEPLVENDFLWQTKNLVISPHIAASGGTFTGNRIAKMVSENVLRYVRGDTVLNQQPIEAVTGS